MINSDSTVKDNNNTGIKIILIIDIKTMMVIMMVTRILNLTIMS